MGKVSGAQFDANAAAAMAAFFTRTGIEAVETVTPFMEMLRGEHESPEVRAKLGVLMGSMLSGVLGALILVRASALKPAP